EAGIGPRRLLPGTGACALPDAVRLTAHAVARGCRGVLLLPPFYYKPVTDDGLFASVAELIERVGRAELRVYLYHIPPVAQVGYSLALVERLVHAYPGVIAGLKDSSGDWSHTLALIERGFDDFRVFSGSETFLLRNLRTGGAGAISATANATPDALVTLYREWRSERADTLQDALGRTRAIFQRYPMIAALKAFIAESTHDPEWERVRPPLTPFSAGQRSERYAALREERSRSGPRAGPTGGRARRHPCGESSSSGDRSPCRWPACARTRSCCRRSESPAVAGPSTARPIPSTSRAPGRSRESGSASDGRRRTARCSDRSRRTPPAP